MMDEATRERFIREARQLGAQALSIRAHLEAVQEALRSGDESQRALAQEHFNRLLEHWGEFPSVIERFHQQQREESR